MRLKENTLYLVMDDQGQLSGGESGLYDRDTRFLSRLEWRIENLPPTVLSTHRPEPYRFSQHATEPHLGHVQRLELRRKGMLDGAGYVETVRVKAFDSLQNYTTSYGREMPVLQNLELKLDCDFRDMFEVRGLPPLNRDIQVQSLSDGLVYAYTGEDGVRREVKVTLEPMGEVLEEDEVLEERQTMATLDLPGATHEKGEERPITGRKIRWQIPQEGSLELTIKATTFKNGQTGNRIEESALAQEYRDWRAQASIKVGNRLIQRVFDRASEDLRSLLFDTAYGDFPAAGIPWYVTPFGRDSIIVALMTIPWYPNIAKGVLSYLAAFQGKNTVAKTLEAPGKILHEQRDGEASQTGRTPFTTYYGTVDATPLWVCLLGDYLEWTGDLETVRNLQPNMEAALEWMAGPDADPDGDGFIEYSPHKGGMTNMVWKDSGDSTFNEAGQDLEAPIAVVEVQAYAYRAYISAAKVYTALEQPEKALEYKQKALILREKFQQHFWLETLGTYAHALNAQKEPARVKVSNAGHALWAGIVPDELAPKVAETLFSSEMWSGWGIRTLAEGEPRYNPVSYHNGSVWPHDNALIALGLARYGLLEPLKTLALYQLESAAITPDARLPELYAGFRKEEIEGLPASPPVPYPAACHPQAWDAAAPFAYLWATLGFGPGIKGNRNGVPEDWGTVQARALFQGESFEIV